MIKATDTQRTLHHLIGAMSRRHPVTITYVCASGRGTVRTIEPYALLTNKAGNRYFKAMDRETGEHRSWRLDRITHYTVHRTVFTVERPAEVEPTPAPVGDAQHAEEISRSWAAEGETISVERISLDREWQALVEEAGLDGVTHMLLRVLATPVSTNPESSAGHDADQAVGTGLNERN